MADETIWTYGLKLTASEGWFEHRRKFALFRYQPAGMNVIKAGMKSPVDPVAQRELSLWLAGTLPGLADWLDEMDCRYVIAMPGHRPVTDDTETPNEHMCRVIERRAGLGVLRRVLLRVDPVKSYWRDGVHPQMAEHVA